MTDHGDFELETAKESDSELDSIDAAGAAIDAECLGEDSSEDDGADLWADASCMTAFSEKMKECSTAVTRFTAAMTAIIKHRDVIQGDETLSDAHYAFTRFKKSLTSSATAEGTDTGVTPENAPETLFEQALQMSLMGRDMDHNEFKGTAPMAVVLDTRSKKTRNFNVMSGLSGIQNVQSATYLCGFDFDLQDVFDNMLKAMVCTPELKDAMRGLAITARDLSAFRARVAKSNYLCSRAATAEDREKHRLALRKVTNRERELDKDLNTKIVEFARVHGQQLMVLLPASKAKARTSAAAATPASSSGASKKTSDTPKSESSAKKRKPAKRKTSDTPKDAEETPKSKRVAKTAKKE